MRTKFALVVSLFVLISLPVFASTYKVELGGGLSGDPDGSGFGVFTIEGTTVSYTLAFEGIGTPTAAHIHDGGPEDDGPVVVDLMPAFGSGSATGSVTGDPEVIEAIMASPGDFYVNIHTTDHSGGAIRGQLRLVASSPESLTLPLTGESEVPGPGDLEGSGIVTLDFFIDSIGYTFQLSNLMNPIAAHIHIGSALESGPVFVDLEVNFASGIAIGEVPIDQTTREMILNNLENFYVNVHTTEFQGGALRAQLGKEWILPVVGKVQGANDTNFVTDVRILNLSEQPASIRVDFFPTSLTGLDGPSVSRTISIPAKAQAVADDIVGNLLGTSGLGAATFVSSRDLRVIGRVINDLREQGLGTNGLFLEAPRVTEARMGRSLPFLSNASPAEVEAGEGFRTNLGFFNPSGQPVELTVNVHRSSDGFVIGSATTTVQPYQHLQQPIFDLVSEVPEEDRDREDFYATWDSDGPLLVYGAVTDNTTGDALVID